MAGIFGGVNQNPSVYAALQGAFSDVWGTTQTHEFHNGVLGGHAPSGQAALQPTPDGSVVAVDGEMSIYRHAKQQAVDSKQCALFEHSAREFSLTALCKGNVVAVDRDSRIWRMAADVSGSFPLYYAVNRSGLLFSSSLRALNRITGARPDPIGVLEFLREGYTLHGRCLVDGVRRVLPGQVIIYDSETSHVSVTETSRLWTQLSGAPSESAHPLIEEAWHHLRGAVARSVKKTNRNVLMLSAGWDSRTLLAAMLERCGVDEVETFTHGDSDSREARIARHISNSCRVVHRHAPINDAIYDIAQLQSAFARVENVVFPHWHRSGRILSELGNACLVAGVYGETLGGHYGPATLLHGTAKIASVLRHLLPSSGNQPSYAYWSTRDIGDLLRLQRLERFWYLDQDWLDMTPDALAEINSDTDGALRRFKERGVETALQLIEAFITEHRGTQYINAQLLSARSGLDIAMPYTDRDLLEFATRVPFHLKIHNRMNRQMLRRHAAQLLRFPCAATLVPASSPIAVQEASRLARKSWEQMRWRCHFASGGVIGYPHLGWADFEFSRDGVAFRNIVEDLRCDWWDVDALKKFVSAVRDGTWRAPMHPVSDQLMKIYTVDLMFR